MRFHKRQCLQLPPTSNNDSDDSDQSVPHLGFRSFPFDSSTMAVVSVEPTVLFYLSPMFCLEFEIWEWLLTRRSAGLHVLCYDYSFAHELVASLALPSTRGPMRPPKQHFTSQDRPNSFSAGSCARFEQDMQKSCNCHLTAGQQSPLVKTIYWIIQISKVIRIDPNSCSFWVGIWPKQKPIKATLWQGT